MRQVMRCMLPVKGRAADQIMQLDPVVPMNQDERKAATDDQIVVEKTALEGGAFLTIKETAATACGGPQEGSDVDSVQPSCSLPQLYLSTSTTHTENLNEQGAGGLSCTLNTISIGSSPLAEPREPTPREDADGTFNLDTRGDFDGIWTCNYSESELPPQGVSRWAREIRIQGSSVVLATGEEVRLEDRGGLLLLEDKPLIRVGDRLLRYGQSSILVYERLGNA
eukprot:TRINITY_DN31975_c0_g1_i2.p1 TRINITY_DN31975_c0_g1~~TRINITY_DN31975_c0_g1_i2.p1  ORF type:complete len:224 (-),score=21.15 TRINITY_DN31975_c0_g1_i2:239-910(-)